MIEATGSIVSLTGVRRKLGPGVKFYCAQLQIQQHAHTALWGPSGCGKSTLLNLVSGLLRPEAGDIIVDGVPIHDMDEGDLDAFRGQKLGFIFQTFNLLAPFTALQNVLLGMRFSDTVPEKEWKQRATQLLERVGLGHRLHAKPRTLSVGEQQRVAIARALANRQKLIVADEPTGSLDPKNAESVMQLLLELCAEEQVTLLMVTHDRNLADRLPNLFDCTGLVTEDPS